MRIVSLVPAATDWLVAFGAADLLVGRSHGCDAPSVQALPVLTRPAGDTWAVDLDALQRLRPDLVVTSKGPGDPAPALAGEVFDFSPHTFKEILDRALALGRAAGRLPEAMRVLAEGEVRLRRLRDRLGLERRDRAREGLPRVAVIGRLDPLTLIGRWVPDLVAHAGGQPVLAESGAPSREITHEVLAEADPDVIVVVSQGRAESDVRRDLQALRQGRVVALDDARLLLPGPNLVEAAERLAAALYPARFA